MVFAPKPSKYLMNVKEEFSREPFSFFPLLLGARIKGDKGRAGVWKKLLKKTLALGIEIELDFIGSIQWSNYYYRNCVSEQANNFLGDKIIKRLKRWGSRLNTGDSTLDNTHKELILLWKPFTVLSSGLLLAGCVFFFSVNLMGKIERRCCSFLSLWHSHKLWTRGNDSLLVISLKSSSYVFMLAELAFGM